jgi:hypothetical protein
MLRQEMNMKTAVRLSAIFPVVLALASSSLAGCGSDSKKSSEPDGTGGSAGKDDKSDSGTPTGAGGSTDEGSGGAAGSSTSAPCGEKNCEPMEGNPAAACCISSFESKCGIVSGMGCVEPPKPPPNGCPALPASMGLNITSCCTKDGMCGVDLNFAGMGCVDLATAAAMAMAMGLPVGQTPTSGTCTPGDAGM